LPARRAAIVGRGQRADSTGGGDVDVGCAAISSMEAQRVFLPDAAFRFMLRSAF
jgi:hypothetical protein